MGISHGVEHLLSLCGRYSSAATQTFGCFGKSRLATQIGSLSVNGVAQVPLKGRAPFGGRQPDLVEIIFLHFSD